MDSAAAQQGTPAREGLLDSAAARTATVEALPNTVGLDVKQHSVFVALLVNPSRRLSAQASRLLSAHTLICLPPAFKSQCQVWLLSLRTLLRHQ